jgi:hypothetical protein
MKKELDDALCRDFPNLFQRRNLSMRETAFAFGFQCGDGWEPLIRRLAEKLEKIILSLPEDKREQFAADQVKEKFGGLRFSLVTGGSDETWKLIMEAEDESYKICEDCGKPGTRRGGGYIQTLCDVCHATRINSRIVKSADGF